MISQEKKRAYELSRQGVSYKQIGKQLGIGKTTAYDYVREAKAYMETGKNESTQENPKASSNASNVSPNQQTNGLQGTLERLSKKVDKVIEQSSQKAERAAVPNRTPNASNVLPNQEIPKRIDSEKAPKPLPKPKEFTGDELIQMEFDNLEFEGKFLELIGKPARKFSGIIWGLPKGGKSNFAIRFADYLQEYFGRVVYFAAEEGESTTLKNKFVGIGGSKVTIVETRNKDVIREYLSEREYDYVFIDSINNAGIDSDFLEELKQENKNKSFIAIVQATKSGNFKGDQSLTHNCDFIIRVSDGVAHHTGRFGEVSEVNIFDEPLYKKNPNNKTTATEIIPPIPEPLKTETINITGTQQERAEPKEPDNQLSSITNWKALGLHIHGKKQEQTTSFELNGETGEIKPIEPPYRKITKYEISRLLAESKRSIERKGINPLTALLVVGTAVVAGRILYNWIAKDEPNNKPKQLPPKQ